MLFLREIPLETREPLGLQLGVFQAPIMPGEKIVAFASEEEHDRHMATKKRFMELASQLVEITRERIASDVSVQEARRNATMLSAQLLSVAAERTEGKVSPYAAANSDSSRAISLLLAWLADGAIISNNDNEGEFRASLNNGLSSLLSEYVRYLKSVEAFESLFGHGMGKGFRMGHGERDVLELIGALLSNSKQTLRIARVLVEVKRQRESIEAAGREGGCGGP